ncbi:hypothetical protein V8D89_012129 [Ganoderma adspersum]
MFHLAENVTNGPLELPLISHRRPSWPTWYSIAPNRPDSLDAALRRAGQFDHEIGIGVPDEEAQALYDPPRPILKTQARRLLQATPGYIGADQAALTGAAGIIAVERIFKQISEGTLVLPENAGISVEIIFVGPAPKEATKYMDGEYSRAPQIFEWKKSSSSRDRTHI